MNSKRRWGPAQNKTKTSDRFLQLKTISQTQPLPPAADPQTLTIICYGAPMPPDQSVSGAPQRASCVLGVTLSSLLAVSCHLRTCHITAMWRRERRACNHDTAPLAPTCSKILLPARRRLCKIKTDQQSPSQFF